jgi:hypothetical protein
MKDILDLKDMENYSHDLKKQNRRKNGKPFILPDKIIEILARIRADFNASLRWKRVNSQEANSFIRHVTTWIIINLQFVQRCVKHLY